MCHGPDLVILTIYVDLIQKANFGDKDREVTSVKDNRIEALKMLGTSFKAFLSVPGMGVIQSGEMSAPGLAVGTVAKSKGKTVRFN
jgi:hypothetical protein